MAIIRLTQPMTEQEERETQNSNNNYLDGNGIPVSEKGVPGGVETLSSAGKLTHMPSAIDVGAVPTARTVNSKPLSGNIALTAADVGSVPASERGANGGIPTLDANGKVVQVSLSAETIGDIHMLKGTKSGTVPAATVYGSIYYSIDIAVSFDMTLPSIPAITTGFFTNGFGYVRIRSITTTGFLFNITNAVTTASINYNLYWTAMW